MCREYQRIKAILAIPTVGRAQVEPIKLLGSGGFGEVTLARWLGQDGPGGAGCLIAVKEPMWEGWEGELLDEAAVQATLKGPNIVPIACIVRDADGSVVGVGQELCDGGTLADFLDARGPKDPPLAMLERLTVLEDILKAVEQIHVGGYAHMDLKPANVGIREGTEGAVLKVFDFGHALPVGGLPLNGARGTPGYMAPEMVAGHALVSPALDIWSVGALMAELASSMRQDVAVEVETGWGGGAREMLWPLLPSGVEPDWAELASACLATDPAERPTASQALLHVKALLEKWGKAAGRSGGRLHAATRCGCPCAAASRLPSSLGLYSRPASPSLGARSPSPPVGPLHGVQLPESLELYRQSGHGAGEVAEPAPAPEAQGARGKKKKRRGRRGGRGKGDHAGELIAVQQAQALAADSGRPRGRRRRGCRGGRGKGRRAAEAQA